MLSGRLPLVHEARHLAAHDVVDGEAHVALRGQPEPDRRRREERVGSAPQDGPAGARGQVAHGRRPRESGALEPELDLGILHEALPDRLVPVVLDHDGDRSLVDPDHVRVDFIEASLFVPPDGWFHQHFNTGHDPARYLAATWGGDGKWFMRSLGGGGRTHRLGKTSTRKGGNLIEYEDEDPAIREIFQAELRKNGVEFRMPKKKI